MKFPSTTEKISHEYLNAVFVIVCKDANGAVAKVLLTSGKSAPYIAEWAMAVQSLINLALAEGITIEKIAGTLTGTWGMRFIDATEMHLSVPDRLGKILLANSMKVDKKLKEEE